jgi:hypothetical protein
MRVLRGLPMVLLLAAVCAAQESSQAEWQSKADHASGGECAQLSMQATALQKRRFGAALEDASDSLQSSTESANAMLAAQIAKRGEEKNKAKLDHPDVK